jgi:hypothetical protein
VGVGSGAERASAGTGVVRVVAEAFGVVCSSSEAERRLVSGSGGVCWITGGGGMEIWDASAFPCAPLAAWLGSSLATASASASASGGGSADLVSGGAGSIVGGDGAPKRDENQAGLRMQNRTTDARMREMPNNAMSGAIGKC